MIGALVVHGMGRQKENFADGLRAAVTAKLGQTAGRVLWEPVHWAPILDPREQALLDAMDSAVDPSGARIRLDWQFVRKFVLHNFGDATAYQRDQHIESAGQLIHQRVSNAVEKLAERLADPTAPVVVMAHSLGGHIMSNYIWDRQHPSADQQKGQPLAPLPTLAGMITFGCNIPLFALAYRDAKPIDLPGVAISDPAVIAAVRWLNFLDRDDVLGWPLRPLYERDRGSFTPGQRRTFDHLEDHELSVGGLLTSWNPASHDFYWEDPVFVQRVADYLKTILALRKP